jgi:hypothetical protein
LTKNTAKIVAATKQKQRVSAAYEYDDNNNISTIDNYIKSIRIMNKRTAYEYLTRLNSFNAFIKNEFGGTLNANDLLAEIKQGVLDPYDILTKYSGYLQSSYNISTPTLKNRVVTAKSFFEYFDVEISPRKFKLKVKLPRISEEAKKPYRKKM